MYGHYTVLLSNLNLLSLLGNEDCFFDWRRDDNIWKWSRPVIAGDSLVCMVDIDEVKSLLLKYW